MVSLRIIWQRLHVEMNWTYTELVIEVAVAVWWFEVRVANG